MIEDGVRVAFYRGIMTFWLAGRIEKQSIGERKKRKKKMREKEKGQKGSKRRGK